MKTRDELIEVMARAMRGRDSGLQYPQALVNASAALDALLAALPDYYPVTDDTIRKCADYYMDLLAMKKPE